MPDEVAPTTNIEETHNELPKEVELIKSPSALQEIPSAITMTDIKQSASNLEIQQVLLLNSSVNSSAHNPLSSSVYHSALDETEYAQHKQDLRQLGTTAFSEL